MTQFRVQVYWEMQSDIPDEDRVVATADHKQAAASVLRSMGGGWADWIRVEQQERDHSVVCFLDSTYGSQFDYEASFPRYGITDTDAIQLSHLRGWMSYLQKTPARHGGKHSDATVNRYGMSML